MSRDARKPVLGISDQVWHKAVYTATEEGYITKLEIGFKTMMDYTERIQSYYAVLFSHLHPVLFLARLICAAPEFCLYHHR